MLFLSDSWADKWYPIRNQAVSAIHITVTFLGSACEEYRSLRRLSWWQKMQSQAQCPVPFYIWPSVPFWMWSMQIIFKNIALTDLYTVLCSYGPCLMNFRPDTPMHTTRKYTARRGEAINWGSYNITLRTSSTITHCIWFVLYGKRKGAKQKRRPKQSTRRIWSKQKEFYLIQSTTIWSSMCQNWILLRIIWKQDY